MNIISIDSSKVSTGLYIKLKDKAFSMCIDTHGMTDKEAYIFIQGKMQNIIEKYKIEVAFIEDYPFNTKNSRSVTVLAEIKGIIMAELYKRNVYVIKVPIPTWQGLCKGVLPKKSAKKKYLEHVEKYYNKKFKTTDEADAYMIIIVMYLIYKGLTKTDGHVKLQKKMRALGKLF